MQGTFFFLIKITWSAFVHNCVCSCWFLSLKENIPSMYNRTNGFESIAELLNILCLGHLRVVATKEIGPSTEIVMDYFIQRSCFHPSGSCSCCKCSHLFVISVYLQGIVYWIVLCASFVVFGIQEKPYSRELCVQCSSCYRGIHHDCLTKEDCDKLDSDGITCSVCITSNKKRALAFPSNSQRLPHPATWRKPDITSS